MKTLTTIAVVLIGLTTVFALNETFWIDYRLVPGQKFLSQRGLEERADKDTITCTTTGKVCDDDCKRVWLCSNNNGVLQPGLLETCTVDKICNAGVCSTTLTPECSPAAQKAFVCLAEGMFPDPTTCKKYHFCINKGGKFTDYPRSCPMHYGYHAGNTYCSRKLENNYCRDDYPVRICTEPGQHGSVKDNRSIYYICMLYENQGNILYPYLHVCPNGREYDDNYNCK